MYNFCLFVQHVQQSN